ncbi:hypothetical protein DV735_g4184, partial [Chaetothyriales sp. CBS 134920]
MPEIKPYKIDVPQAKIDRLKQKLALADFPDEVADEEPWVRGPPLADIKRLAAYWADGFDWRKAEAKLNQYPHYTTEIPIDNFGAFDVHFIHQRSHVPNAIPLIFIHGWPGSFIEATKILPLLVQGGKDFPAFHVVALSLIDFGFSAVSGKKGFSSFQHAETAHKLMLRLGYTEYVAQGGDLGYAISRAMASKYPSNVRAHHVNMSIPKEPTKESHPELYEEVQKHTPTDAEKARVERGQHFWKEGAGYFAIQSTRPQTIGYNITDSPVGLLAWIYEKLHDWSDHDNYAWTDDEILTWISIYHFSRPGAAASQRIYYEQRHGTVNFFDKSAEYIDVPLGLSLPPKEIVSVPVLWNKTMGPIVFERVWKVGGHFAAYEQPEELVRDLREMFGKDGGAYGLVKAHDGFE